MCRVAIVCPAPFRSTAAKHIKVIFSFPTPQAVPSSIPSNVIAAAAAAAAADFSRPNTPARSHSTHPFHSASSHRVPTSIPLSITGTAATHYLTQPTATRMIVFLAFLGPGQASEKVLKIAEQQAQKTLQRQVRRRWEFPEGITVAAV